MCTVHTQYFNDDKEQKLYGELGAIRLPEHHTIDYLNKCVSKDDWINLIKFMKKKYFVFICLFISIT